ncbi:MAG TPA: vWA domain-containing protein [Thermoguttaceae bacterium]|nr:vWA domain-containing protein [Thermoguttaceae bacterium]
MSRAPYSQEISRQNKACFLFLLDQSFSMEEPLGNSPNRKCDELITAINGWLQNMAIRASGDEGIKDWMDVGVFGYRTDQSANPIIESALQGPLAGRMLVSIAEVGANPARIDTRMQYIPDEETGEMIEVPCEVPVWVDPKAEGGTPMCHMLYHTHQVLSQWIAQHPRSFPPIVVHITDGESQDGDPNPYADAVKNLATEDGNVLLFNCHLSMTAADPFMFPSREEGLPDELARVLFRMSSVLPDPFYRHGMMEGFQLQQSARGMAFNADMVCLIQFLNMGTQAAPGLR